MKLNLLAVPEIANVASILVSSDVAVPPVITHTDSKALLPSVPAALEPGGGLIATVNAVWRE